MKEMIKNNGKTAAGASHSSDEESDGESAVEDENICTSFELEQYFQRKFCVQDERVVSLKKNYVLGLEKDNSFTRLAAGLSDGSVHLFNINAGGGLVYSSADCIPPPASNDSQNGASTSGVRFMDETANLLLVGATNRVRLFDLRTQGEVGRFQNNTEDDIESPAMPNKILCFDRNANSRVLCVGTEQHQHNVLLLFYDLRERKKLGDYFESHQDDVTSLRFHPENPDLLCSGSTDGLINIFDIQQTTEDEALLKTFNTVSSVHKLNWHKNVYNKSTVSCITHTNDFKLYDCDEGDLIVEFDRVKITESIKRKTPANCNLIDCHNMTDGELFLLTGSNLNKGEIMRSVLVQNKTLLPSVDFQDNKQIVRESVFDVKSNILVTAGESGIVTLWAEQSGKPSNTSNLKVKKKKSSKFTTPY